MQKKALARREQTQQDFDNFTRQLKEAARSEKPSKHHTVHPLSYAGGWADRVHALIMTVWIAQKEMDAKRSTEEQQARRDERDAYAAESRRRQAEIRASTQ